MLRYTKTAMFLHWLIAIMIICAFTLGVTMTNMHGLSPTKLKYFSWHKWLGCTVFGLACLRLLRRLWHPAPPYPYTMSKWQQNAASGLHALMYFLLFAVPLSGYFYSLAAGVPVVYLGIVPLPVLIDPNPEWKPILKLVHYSLNVALLGGFCLHVLAALKHQFIDRDDILKRMLP
jgi:cytochrome b561